MPNRSAIIRAGGEGDMLWFNNDLLTFKTTADETNQALTLFEELTQQGKMTPLHLHPEADETFCVLEGEMRIHVDGTDRTVGPGGVAFIPRGLPHAVLVTSATARVLTIVTPGCKALESFFREVGQPATASVLPPSAPLPLERIRAAAARHGSVVILGPPPFVAAAASHSA
ncbi:MAG: quercetin 2,3-dioxygenase [Gemmatimonadota bacterium]|nr:quercetin 2,3-dioxygenase [Gemmatimonadota bacterium]